MRKLLTLISFSFLCSCTTILHSKKTKVNLHAPKNTKIKFKGEEFLVNNDKVSIFPIRAKDSLRFELSNDSITTQFSFPKKTSGNYFLNFFSPYYAGFIIDLTNKKRFTYKKNLKFGIDSTENKFISLNNLPIAFKRNDVFVYTTPLKAMDVFTQPMLTLGAEYFVTNTISLSAEYGTVYTKRLGDKPKLKILKTKGRSFRYELKIYNILGQSRNSRFNNYLGFETRFLRYQFNDENNFRAVNEDIQYFVNIPFGVHKKVDIYNLKYGINYPIGKHFYFDVYTGLGVRVRDIKNIYNSTPPEQDTSFLNDDDDDCYLCFRKNKEQDSGSFFNFTLGFKFGYKF
jgi:hypothetical protein